MSPSITIRNNPSLSYTRRQIAKCSVSLPACGASPGALQGVKWGSKSWVNRGPQQPLPSFTMTAKGKSTEYHTLRAECWQECRLDFSVLNFTSAFKFLRPYRGWAALLQSLGRLASFVACSTRLSSLGDVTYRAVRHRAWNTKHINPYMDLDTG